MKKRDGISHIILNFSDDAVLKEIQEEEQWKAFPAEETVQILLYGNADGTDF